MTSVIRLAIVLCTASCCTVFPSRVLAEVSGDVVGYPATATADLTIGYSGTGVLSTTMWQDSTINSRVGYIGYNGSGVGTVVIEGNNVTWNCNDDTSGLPQGNLYAGFFGTGTLDIRRFPGRFDPDPFGGPPILDIPEGAGEVHCSEAFVGKYSSSQGTVTIDGAESLLECRRYIQVGSNGTGTLTVSNGGALMTATDTGYYDVSRINAYDGSTGSVTVTGSGSTWTSLNQGIILGNWYGSGESGSGELNILSGGRVTSPYLSVSRNSTLTVSGAGSQMSMTGNLSVSQGSVSMDDNASANVRGISISKGGSLAVAGLGTSTTSEQTTVGDGSLAVSGGAALYNTTANMTVLGSSEGTSGTATVTGAGSLWNNTGSLYVGRSGNGTLYVEAGAAVNNFAGTVAQDVNSIGLVKVDGAGSSWTNRYNLVVGDAGHGSLTVSNGARVSSTDCVVGNALGSSGSVNVEGSDSEWSCAGYLKIGVSGTGSLTINDGGTVSSSGRAYLGNGTTSASLAIDGAGSLMTCDQLELAEQSKVTVSNGAHLLASGWLNAFGADAAADVTVAGDESVLETNGMVLGSGSILVEQGGTLTNNSNSWIASSGHAATAHLTVRGTGSTWTQRYGVDVATWWTRHPGDTASPLVGTVSILDGASATIFGGDLQVATDDDVVGTVIVSGPGSTLSTERIRMGGDDYGHGGEATLTITNGGVVTSTDPDAPESLNISNADYCEVGGAFSNGQDSVAIDGPGSAWRVTNMDLIFSSGATLSVSNGATLETFGLVSVANDRMGICTIDGSAVTIGDGGLILHDAQVSASTVTAKSNGVYGVGLYGSVVIDRGTSFVSDERLAVSNSSLGDQPANVRISGEGTNATFGGALQLKVSLLFYDPSYQGHLVVSESAQLQTASYEADISLLGMGTMWVENEIGGGSSLTVRDSGSHYRANGNLIIYEEGKLSCEADAVIDVTGALTNSGLIRIGDGGRITGDILANTVDGTIAISVTRDGMLSSDTDFENNGVMRLSAASSLASGVYTPITVSGDWLGAGTYESFGGVWDNAAHTFTVGSVLTETSGSQATLDLSAAPRLNVTDSGSGQQVMASFGQSATTIGFWAAPMSESTGLADLSLMITEGESVLSGWDFDTDLTGGEDVLLSFFVGNGFTADSLEIWHYDNSGVWTTFAADDLTYSDGWVNFTVDGFSGYAVTGMPVPEPATMGLLALGGLALLRRRSAA